jgi:hypothetical protein
LRKQDFEGAKNGYPSSKPELRLFKSKDTLITYGIMVSQTNINQAESISKAIELGLSMDMDLAVAKLNLAGVAMSRRKLEATNFLNEARKLDKQNMLTDQIKMMKDQMKKI